MFAKVVALLYVSLLCAAFIDYYLVVRAASANEIVDFTVVIVFLGVASVVPGLLIGRPWSVALPLSAFAIAATLAIAGVFDDRYSAVAEDRGGVVGLAWLGIAALVCCYAVPAAAIGFGLRLWGEHLARRFDRRQ